MFCITSHTETLQCNIESTCLNYLATFTQKYSFSCKSNICKSIGNLKGANALVLQAIKISPFFIASSLQTCVTFD